MKRSSEKYLELFLSLTKTVHLFIQEIKKHRLQDMATEKWTVKDVFSHITFWHNYYAQNYSALAVGTKPYVFSPKGGSTLNQEGVDKLNRRSLKNLVTLLNQAQSSLYKSIVLKKVPKMSYKVGREYKTEDFLEMVTRHLQRHTVQVRRSKKVI